MSPSDEQTAEQIGAEVDGFYEVLVESQTDERLVKAMLLLDALCAQQLITSFSLVQESGHWLVSCVYSGKLHRLECASSFEALIRLIDDLSEPGGAQ